MNTLPCFRGATLGALLAAAFLSRAAAHEVILTNVPMQGPMIHVEVIYHADHNALHIHVEPGTPALTPLSVSHPDAMFAAGDPWHHLLDPHAMGWAFNRQYGFVMGAESDPLPAGHAVWFRQLRASPGLKVFRYRGMDPKAWDPIFGTDGSAPVFQWGGTMFHPAYACAPGSGPQEAEYEAFLVDAATGEPAAGVAAERFLLGWSDGSAGMPMLEIARRVMLAWPAAGTNYVAEAAPAVQGPWTPLPDDPFLHQNKLTLLVEPAASAQFFRLAPKGGGGHGGGHGH